MEKRAEEMARISLLHQEIRRQIAFRYRTAVEIVQRPADYDGFRVALSAQLRTPDHAIPPKIPAHHHNQVHGLRLRAGNKSLPDPREPNRPAYPNTDRRQQQDEEAGTNE